MYGWSKFKQEFNTVGPFKTDPTPEKSYISGSFLINGTYRAFLHDVMTAILAFTINEKAAMLVSQTNPVGVQLFSYVNAFFCMDFA